MSLGGNGLRDWLTQRLTAVVIGVYTVFVMLFILLQSDLNYETWRALFSNRWMQLSTIFVVIGLALHAWIGIWTVFTDYIKSIAIRYILNAVVIIALFAYVGWVVQILRGI